MRISHARSRFAELPEPELPCSPARKLTVRFTRALRGMVKNKNPAIP